MNDRELGKALLSLDTTPKPSDLDPRHLARNIVHRDRRRIRLLAGVATVFWVLAVAGMVWLVSFYVIQVAPRLRAYAAGRVHLENDWNDWARAGDLAAKSLLLFLIALLVAAISTVLLILLSRHATLRQINASLIELSDRLNPSRNRPQSSEMDSPG